MNGQAHCQSISSQKPSASICYKIIIERRAYKYKKNSSSARKLDMIIMFNYQYVGEKMIIARNTIRASS